MRSLAVCRDKLHRPAEDAVHPVSVHTPNLGIHCESMQNETAISGQLIGLGIN
jgi:hypothetical protein